MSALVHVIIMWEGPHADLLSGKFMFSDHELAGQEKNCYNNYIS